MIEGISGNLLTAGIQGAATAVLDVLRDRTLLPDTVNTTVSLLQDDIPNILDILTDWCNTPDCLTTLQSYKNGDHDVTRQERLDFFVEHTALRFLPDVDAHAKAEKILGTFFSFIHLYLYTGRKATLFFANHMESRIEQIHTSQMDLLSQISQRLNIVSTCKTVDRDGESENDTDELANIEIDEARDLLQCGKAIESQKKLQRLRERLVDKRISTKVLFRIANNLGAAALDSDDTATAIREFKQAYEIMPDNPIAITNLARIAIVEGDWEEAFIHARDAIKKTPDDPYTLVVYLEALHGLGLNDKFAELSTQEKVQNNPITALGLGIIKHHDAEYTEAERYLRISLSLDPHDPQAALTLAATIVGQMQMEFQEDPPLPWKIDQATHERLKEADGLASEAVQRLKEKDNTGRIAEALAIRAGIRTMIPELRSEALADTEEALSITPNHQRALWNRAILLLSSGSITDAIECFELYSGSENKLETSLYLARAYNMAERYDDTIRTLRPFWMPTGNDKSEIDVAELLLAAYWGLKLYGEVTQIFDEFVKYWQNDPDALFVIAEQEIRNGNSTRAIELLRGEEKNSSDHLRDRIQLSLGNILFRSGNFEEAAQCFEGLVSTDPDHRTCVNYAIALFRAGKYHDVLQFASQVRGDTQTGTAIDEIVAQTYANIGDYPNAVQVLRNLVTAHPEEEYHKYNLAASLVNAGMLEEALDLYNTLTSTSTPPMEVLVSRAQLLKALGKPHQAFESIAELKHRYWDNGSFVSVYMDLASAAGHDDIAHECRIKLQQLLAIGDVDGIQLEHHSIEDLKERVRTFHKQQTEWYDKLIQGQAPWLFIDELLGHPPYWAWRLRTQPSEWFLDNADTRAAYYTYSTIESAIVSSSDGKSKSRNISCPPRGTTVVADYTALISLHRLGLLTKAGEYFGKIHVPMTYLPRIVKDATKLITHQLSQRTTITILRSMADSGGICIQKDNTESLLRLDNEPDKNIYGLHDALTLLHTRGLLDDKQYDEISAIYPSKDAQNGTPPLLQSGQRVLTSISFLCMAFSHGILDDLAKEVRLVIRHDDYQKIVSQEKTFQMQDDVHRWHHSLWHQVVSDEHFIPTLLLPDGETEQINNSILAIDALTLARQLKLPLLVDDRACQTVIYTEQNLIAFGSAHLLNALSNEGMLTADEEAQTYQQLIEWRYRFIIPPVRVLLHATQRFRGCLPGEPLRKWARYVHDCMRDPGLLYLIEDEKLPITMAHRLFNHWVLCATALIMNTWDDESFSDEQATTLTSWVLTELLPSPPKTADPLTQAEILQRMGKAIFMAAMAHAKPNSNIRRINLAVRTIAKALLIDDAAYLRMVIGVIDDIKV